MRKRVSKVPGATVLNNVGDLDVLVADPRRRRLEVIECKDLSNARTPHERKLEIEDLLGSERVENPIVVRHQETPKVGEGKPAICAHLAWTGTCQRLESGRLYRGRLPADGALLQRDTYANRPIRRI